MSHHPRFFFSFILFSAVLPTFVHANASIFSLLQQDKVVRITLTADFDNLFDHRREEIKENGTLQLVDPAGNEQAFPLEMELRGRYRRMNCDFPPLRLKFDRDILSANQLDPEFNKYKLVTHCLNDRWEGNENLLQEYLTYELFRTLTPQSFRVQLLEITYHDTKEIQKDFVRYGLLIEDTDEMTARLGGTELEMVGLGLADVNPSSESLVAMFQYMIGNYDWDLKMLRNVKLVQTATSNLPVLVPYDFDYTGLVDASYARPISSAGMKSLTDRIYRGENTNPVVLRETIALFKAKQATLLEQINSFALLDRRVRKEMAEYLNAFFVELENPDFLKL